MGTCAASAAQAMAASPALSANGMPLAAEKGRNAQDGGSASRCTPCNDRQCFDKARSICFGTTSTSSTGAKINDRSLRKTWVPEQIANQQTLLVERPLLLAACCIQHACQQPHKLIPGCSTAQHLCLSNADVCWSMSCCVDWTTVIVIADFPIGRHVGCRKRHR